jgi:hypothetical protein
MRLTADTGQILPQTPGIAISGFTLEPCDS